MSIATWATVVLLGTVASAEAPVTTPKEGLCETPQRAAATFLANLSDDKLDARHAARCAQTPKDMSRQEKERRVAVLKNALDRSGARVHLQQLPTTTDYLDPITFEPVVVLTPLLSRLRLERAENGEWLIPAAVVLAADAIYDDTIAFDVTRLADYAPDWSKRTWLGVAAWQVAALGLLLALGYFLGFVVVRVGTWKLVDVLSRWRVPLGKKDVLRAGGPVGVIVLCALLWVCVPSLLLPQRLGFFVLQATKLAASVAIIALAYRTVDVISLHFSRVAALSQTLAAPLLPRGPKNSSRVDEHMVVLMKRLSKLAVIVVGVIVVLQRLGVDVGSLVAGLGIGGLAVALAAKDTIGNFFGSIAIFLDRPFHVGDWIESNGAEGTVEHIGFRSTQIRTIKDTVVSIPNAKLADEKIDNVGARHARRIRFIVAIGMHTDVDRVEAMTDGIRAILHAHPLVDQDRIEVHLHAFSPSSLDILVHFYAAAPSWGTELRARHEVMLDVLRLAQTLQVTLAFPTTTIDVATATDAKPTSRAALEAEVRRFAPGGDAVVPPGARVLSQPLPHLSSTTHAKTEGP